MSHKTRAFGAPLKVMAFQVTYFDQESQEEVTTPTTVFRDSDGRITDGNGQDMGPIRLDCEEQVQDWCYSLADKGSFKVREIRPVRTIHMAIFHMKMDEHKQALSIVSGYPRGLSKDQKKILSRGYECYDNPGFYRQLGFVPEKCIQQAIDLFKELYMGGSK